MSPKLYMIGASPPVRAVQMTAKSLGLNLELIHVNTLKKEQMTPEYLKMNPQHTVPTLVDDDGFVIWDSHAIMAYLVSKYGKDDSLYPKDLKKRAIVDQRLHFESGVVFAKIVSILKPVLYGTKRTIDQSDINDVIEAYAFLDTFLENKQWVTGNTVTIADFSLISSITSLNVIVPIDKQKFPRLLAWLQRAETLPCYDANKIGLERYIALVKPLLP